MSALSHTPIEALFVDGPNGRLFGLYTPAVGESRGQILCLSPFTEESNRSRVMLGLAARALAQEGYGTLILDLFGTGDSEGEFEHADFNKWFADITAGVDWLKPHGQPITLWGTRLAALLVAEFARQQPSAARRLLLWQPVTNGKMMFTQYLRLRVANSLESRGVQETTKQLRQRLGDGESLEVAGYRISPRLAADLDAAAMPLEGDWGDLRIDWLERVEEGREEVSDGSRRCVERWKEQGVDVRARPFHGAPFWQLHERFLAPQLVEATVQVMAHG